MTENQHNKNLQELRSEIDEIDTQIVKLIKRRMSIIPRVGEIKKINGEKFFIKSSREIDMIKNLVKQVDGNFLKLTIANIWRKLITLANNEEQALHIGIHNPHGISDYEYLVREYFSQQVLITNFDSATNLIAEMQKSTINIGVFLLPNLEEDFDKKDTMQKNWWINMANNRVGLKIYSKIPFVELASQKNKKNLQLVLTAIKDAEPSESDFTLLSIEVASEVSKTEIFSLFKDHNNYFKILSNVKNSQFIGISLYLIEIQGFYLENDFLIKNLLQNKIKPFIKVLGHYPAPIILD
jgi:chorismate mutase